MLGNPVPTNEWLSGTVTSFTLGSALTVTLDGASTAVNATLAWPGVISNGARVWCVRAGTELVVVALQKAYGQAAASVPTGAFLEWSASTLPGATGDWLWCDGGAYARATYAALNALWSADGYKYGSGDGSTTFNTPNGEGKTLVAMLASDPNFEVVGATAGAATHALTEAENGAHTHTGATGTESVNHTHTTTTGGISANHYHGFSTGTESTGHVHLYNGSNSWPVLAGTWGPVSGGSPHVSGPAGMSGENVNHTHSGNTGWVSSDHSHTGTSGNESAAHDHSISSDGSGTPHNNVQPSLTIYGFIVKT